MSHRVLFRFSVAPAQQAALITAVQASIPVFMRQKGFVRFTLDRALEGGAVYGTLEMATRQDYEACLDDRAWEERGAAVRQVVQQHGGTLEVVPVERLADRSAR